jgi:hypothetical protein
LTVIMHVVDKVAVVSCHLERPLDDRCWAAFSALQAARPGGFEIAALMRPPVDSESESLWLARARIAATRGPLGHHTHWGGVEHARPTGGDDPAALVRAQATWLRERGLEPRLFCGGGWYMDEAVASALAELGYTDCTATAFRPSYLAPDAPRASLDEPGMLQVGRATVAELPTTHSIGMAFRAAFGRRLPAYVHVYFHDADLLDGRRRLALEYALVAIARRRRVARLDSVGTDPYGVCP